MKRTYWHELDASRCQVLKRSGGTEVYALRIAHPELKRPRWFQVSRVGNLYSRYTGKAVEFQAEAEGYIIKAYGDGWEQLVG